MTLADVAVIAIAFGPAALALWGESTSKCSECGRHSIHRTVKRTQSATYDYLTERHDLVSGSRFENVRRTDHYALMRCRRCKHEYEQRWSEYR